MSEAGVMALLGSFLNIPGAAGGLLADGLSGAPVILQGPRKLSTAYTGQCAKFLNIFDNNHVGVQDVGFASNGVINQATLQSMATANGDASPRGTLGYYNQINANNFAIGTSPGVGYESAGINGQPSTRIVNHGAENFDGNNAYTATGVTGPNGNTMIFSLVIATVVDTYGLQFAFKGATDSGAANCYFTSQSFAVDYVNDSSTQRVRFVHNGNTINFLTPTTPFVLTIVADGTNITGYKNGTQVGQFACTDTFDATGQYFIGSDASGNSNIGSAHIGDIVLIKGANSADRTKIIANQKTFYGIT